MTQGSGEPSRPGPRFKFVGGAPCLDFNNTVDWTAQGLVEEHLASFGDLVEWEREAGLATADEARALHRAASAHPRRAAKALAVALELRRALHDVFESLAHGRTPAAAALEQLNAVLPKALSRLRLEVRGGSVHWGWSPDERKLTRVLWPIVWSAAGLLTSPDAGLLKMCALESCGWVYLDRSRNRRRVWCEMRACGNRAKARRHYARRRGRLATSD